jgi:2-isopropylmalate synthase
VEKTFEAIGNGPIDAVKRGLDEALNIDIKILDYEEHALQSGSNSQAAAYIHLLDSDTGRVTYGVGVSSNITRASVRAIFSAINRLGLGEKSRG